MQRIVRGAKILPSHCTENKTKVSSMLVSNKKALAIQVYCVKFFGQVRDCQAELAEFCS